MNSMHCEAMRKLGQCEPARHRAELEAAKAENERLRENDKRWMIRTGSLSAELYAFTVKLAKALPLLRRWCDGFEEIDRGALCRVYEDTERFLAECEKEEKKSGSSS